MWAGRVPEDAPTVTRARPCHANHPLVFDPDFYSTDARNGAFLITMGLAIRR